MTPEAQIPKGWRFHSADFRRSDRPGKVTLCRDGAGQKWWRDVLSAEEKELAEVEVVGHGSTLNEATADAVAKIGGLLLDRRTA